METLNHGSYYQRRMSMDQSICMHDRNKSINSLAELDINDLSKFKEDAMKQMERMLLQTERIHALEDDNEELLAAVERLQRALADRDGLVQELTGQLGVATNRLVTLSLDRESNTLNRNTAEQLETQFHMGSPDQPEIKEKLHVREQEVELLREKLTEQDRELRRKKVEVSELGQELSTLRSQRVASVAAAADARSKSELLGVIRDRMEEKLYWESYAETLLRLVMRHRPELLEQSVLSAASLATTVVEDLPSDGSQLLMHDFISATNSASNNIQKTKWTT